MAERGLFITVEGGEGVGKSTNMTFLESLLGDYGIDVVTTREPGGTDLGEEIRELLLSHRDEPLTAVAELLLILAARAQHISTLIAPALAAGKWVLCDRFTDATYAYQCWGRGLPLDTVRQLELLVQGQVRPDHTILLDVPVGVGMERARSRGNLDRFELESVDFFERVRTGYLALARDDGRRYRVVDASVPLIEVQAELRRFLRGVVAAWRQGQDSTCS